MIKAEKALPSDLDLQLKMQYRQRLEAVAGLLNPNVNRFQGNRDHDMATRLHQNWRDQYIKDRGKPDNYPPRWKNTTDMIWVERNKSKSGLIQYEIGETDADGKPTKKPGWQVDIAHASFDELPADWQNENSNAATFALDYVWRAAFDKRPIDQDFLEEAANAVHIAWLSRPNNRWAVFASGNEGRPYHDPNFTEKLRNQDREHVVIAAETLAR